MNDIVIYQFNGISYDKTWSCGTDKAARNYLRKQDKGMYLIYQNDKLIASYIGGVYLATN